MTSKVKKLELVKKSASDHSIHVNIGKKLDFSEGLAVDLKLH